MAAQPENAITTISQNKQNLNFSFQVLNQIELKNYETFIRKFLEIKLVSELLKTALTVNSEIYVEFVEGTQFGGRWTSDLKTISINILGIHKFLELKESMQYHLLNIFLFELINATRLGKSSNPKFVYDFESEDEWAYYQEKEEYETYCLHRETLLELQKLKFTLIKINAASYILKDLAIKYNRG